MYILAAFTFVLKEYSYEMNCVFWWLWCKSLLTELLARCVLVTM